MTTLKKLQYAKKKNQTVPVGNQRSHSLALVELPFNVISANDSMISFKTIIMISIFFLLSFLIFVLHAGMLITAGFMFYNLLIVFFLIFTITPPLYFFTRWDKFKVALTVVSEMFI